MFILHGGTMKSINPSTYTELGEITISTPQEVHAAVVAARQVFYAWHSLGVEGRIRLLRAVFDDFRLHAEELSLLESREMGMPITESLADTDGTFAYVDWYFDHAPQILAPETTGETPTEIHQVFREPVGIVGAIIPWNFPFANVVWSSLAALIAGNCVIIKHSELCLMSARYIADVFSRHGLPDGAVQFVYGSGDIGAALVDEAIDMITFTGSTAVGMSLYQKAGKKGIRAVMELGGSAPGIVFPSKDVKLVAESIASQRLLNTGQCCDGLKRLIVHRSISDVLVAELATIFSGKKIGNAELVTTEIGPLVSKKQLALIEEQVADASTQGATSITGGVSISASLGGAYYPPTILTNVTSAMRVMKEEVFGPVLPIMVFDTDDEAIELANATPYGLGGYIWGDDIDRCHAAALKIQTGMVGINGVSYIQPFNPFGGYKKSGFGRQHGHFGFEEMTQIKVISEPKATS